MLSVLLSRLHWPEDLVILNMADPNWQEKNCSFDYAEGDWCQDSGISFSELMGHSQTKI